jgi:hypothetical protein
LFVGSSFVVLGVRQAPCVPPQAPFFQEVRNIVAGIYCHVFLFDLEVMSVGNVFVIVRLEFVDRWNFVRPRLHRHVILWEFFEHRFVDDCDRKEPLFSIIVDPMEFWSCDSASPFGVCFVFDIWFHSSVFLNPAGRPRRSAAAPNAAARARRVATRSKSTRDRLWALSLHWCISACLNSVHAGFFFFCGVSWSRIDVRSSCQFLMDWVGIFLSLD